MHHDRIAKIFLELPWVEKYRPQALGDVVAQKDITQTLQIFIDKVWYNVGMKSTSFQKSLPHMLFHGPPGTGKTTTIMACARQMYGARVHQMVLELNASDARGIDVARDQIKDFVSMRHLFNQSMCSCPSASIHS